MTRAAEHLAEVRRRLARSRYDDDADALDELLGLEPSDVWTRTLPGAELPRPRLLPPTSLRIATDPLGLERSAEVVSAVLAADLDLVRRHLGANLHHVDGASVLLATRWSENVIGTATLVLTEDAAGTVAGVHAVGVAAPFRGRGIGVALTLRAVELATSAGADLAVTTTPLAPRLGFTAVG